MSFELPPPTAGIWLIPKRFRQLCRLAGFVKMTGVPIFPNKIQGLPFHHQETTRKKNGEKREKNTKGLATCQSLGAPIFSCKRLVLMVEPEIVSHPCNFLQVDTPQLSTAESSVDIVDILPVLMRWSPTKKRFEAGYVTFDVLRIDVETETIKKDVHGFFCLSYVYIKYIFIYIYMCIW